MATSCMSQMVSRRGLVRRGYITGSTFCMDYKEQGNQAFARKEWQHAVSLYSLAIQESPETAAAAYANRAAALIQLEHYKKALQDCEAGLALESPTALKVKMWWRKAVCERELGLDFGKSVAEGLKLDPTNAKLVEMAPGGSTEGPTTKFRPIEVRRVPTLPKEYTTGPGPVAKAKPVPTYHSFVPPSRPLSYAGITALTRTKDPRAYDYWLRDVDPEEVVAAHRGAGIEPETLDYVYEMVRERGDSPAARSLLNALARCDRFATAASMANPPPF